MEFKPALLDRIALTQLQQLENELRMHTSEEIVIVAYKATGDSDRVTHTAE
ncbi:hypothetical protein [Paenibacillus sacheonensis]|uniref:hypothetical protein n=1 Tax=Paenibacillus sacheonensis TaxID=742054 RepID=UPI0014794F17|nr:hypothetical protein [Paenibacillus sacheonensis]MBM7568402.1 hypothetical protein [Paenibacillus sacheonensis]